MSAIERLLVFNCHEAWVYQLGILGIPIDIVIGLKGRHVDGWDESMRPVPHGARLVRLSDVLRSPGAYRCVIAHNLSDLLEVKSLTIPKLSVFHGTLEGIIADQHPSTPAQELRRATDQYLRMVHAHALATSRLKADSWGFIDDVVENSANVEDYRPATAELARGLRVANDIRRKEKTLLWDFHENAFAGVPVAIVGRNKEMPGILPSRDWADLKQILRKHRFFIHTAHPKLEDGYNMAVLEAMASGLPVLGNRHPSSPVEHGLNGFLSNDPDQLRECARLLLDDPELALRMGAAARETIRAKFPPDKFCTGLRRSIETARNIWGQRPKCV